MTDLRARLEDAFGPRLAHPATIVAGPRAADATATLASPHDLPGAAAALVGPLGMALATIVATDDSPTGGGLSVHYVFEPAAAPPLPDRFATLVVRLDSDAPEVPSLVDAIPAANWPEREVRDLFGVVPAGHPDPRPLVLHDGWPAGLFPLRKSFDPSRPVPREAAPELPHVEVEGAGVFEIPVGPIHAGIIEPGHFRFSSVGETVLHLDARLFYTHRGLEKRMEGLAPLDGFFVAERMCGVCSVAHGLGYCEAVEQAAGLTVPPRAQLLRTIALELERLYNHAGDIGNLCAGASYHYGTSAGLRIKESLQRLNERLAGNRYLRGWLVPGGVQRDLPDAARPVLNAALDDAESALRDLTRRIDGNPSVMDRLEETGLVSPKAARDLATTGVAARASGVDRDARRDHPHAAYRLLGAELNPQVHLDEAGDVNARRRVRELEALESIGLLRRLLGRLEPGPIATDMPAALPPGAIALSSVEGPRGASIWWLRAGPDGRLDRAHLRSASYANWPAVPLAALSAIVPDFPLVNKSFELCYACTDR